jgi:uncharacterized protein with FMN-binding domain
MKKLAGSYLSVLKTIHLLVIGIFFGGLTVNLAILLTIHSEGIAYNSTSSSFILFRLNDSLVYYSFLGITFTAVIYALFTGWGIIRHWWIIMKWLLLFTIAGIYIIVYSPSVNGLAALSNGGIDSPETEKVFSSLLQKSTINNVIMVILLSIVFFISTLKPFGRRDSDLLTENKIARISVLVCLVLSAGFLLIGSLNLNRLRNMKIGDYELNVLKDGTFIGEFNDGGGLYSVKIKITDHRISEVDLTTERESVYIEYARPVTRRILEKQTPDVDVISGATTTSKCIMKAAENAIKSSIPEN